jgi:hypothetical protein
LAGGKSIALLLFHGGIKSDGFCFAPTTTFIWVCNRSALLLLLLLLLLSLLLSGDGA